MEYPGARLTKPVRRTILIAFMAAFFIITPLIIMYSTGYRYDWQAGIIRETGSLSIDAIPTTAFVSLDGLPLDTSLPVQLKNITPKKYQVTISAPGYHTWEKEITVIRRQTTYIKDIQLIKISEPKTLVSGAVDTISIAPTGRQLLVVKQIAAKNEVLLLDLKTLRITPIVSFQNNTPVHFHWSTKHPYVAITLGLAPYSTVLVVNSEKPTEVNNITIAQKRTIGRVQWRETSEPTLYYSTTTSLAMYYPRLREDRPFTKNIYHDWLLADDTLWTLIARSNTLHITSDQLGFHAPFATVSSSDAGFSATGFHFEDIHNKHALISNNEGTMLLAGEDQQFTVAANQALLSPFNAWWLLWNNAELWSYIEGEKPYLLHRSGSTLKKLAPLDTYNTLALQFDNEITALYPYEYIQISLLKKATNDMAVDTDSRQLYYSTAEGLYSMAY